MWSKSELARQTLSKRLDMLSVIHFPCDHMSWLCKCPCNVAFCSGGSSNEAAAMCNEILKAKSRRILVVACVGDVATSAGYHIAGL